jgi:hypothetical protein
MLFWFIEFLNAADFQSIQGYHVWSLARDEIGKREGFPASQRKQEDISMKIYLLVKAIVIAS